MHSDAIVRRCIQLHWNVYNIPIKDIIKNEETKHPQS